jgi:CHAD domain-containing protein
MLDGWRDWLAEADGDADADSEADNELGLVVARRIVRAQRRLIDQGRAISDESPAELLHELRKDAKKLRYLFECFDALLPGRPRKALVRRLKVLQDNLGEHQDTEVHAIRLGELADSLRTAEGDVASWRGARQLTAELDRRRRAARQAFADRFAAYDTPEVHAVMRELIEEIAR